MKFRFYMLSVFAPLILVWAFGPLRSGTRSRVSPRSRAVSTGTLPQPGTRYDYVQLRGSRRRVL